jgi:hypothetical protein
MSRSPVTEKTPAIGQGFFLLVGPVVAVGVDVAAWLAMSWFPVLTVLVVTSGGEAGHGFGGADSVADSK